MKNFFLSYSFFYKLSQNIGGFDFFRKRIIEKYAKSNLSILDIGCGPANMLKYFPNHRLYCGFDTNSNYIKVNKKKKSKKNFFFNKEFNPSLLPPNRIFDLTLIFGLLHHLSDDKVYNLLKKINKIAHKNMQILILDNVRMDKQNFITRFLIDNDRGKFIREEKEYIRLIKKVFTKKNYLVKFSIEHQKFLPYDYIVTKINKA